MFLDFLFQGLCQNSQYWQEIGQVWNIRKLLETFFSFPYVSLFLLLWVQTWEACVNLVGSERKTLSSCPVVTFFICFFWIRLKWEKEKIKVLFVGCWQGNSFLLIFYFFNQKIQSLSVFGLIWVKKSKGCVESKTEKFIGKSDSDDCWY